MWASTSVGESVMAALEALLNDGGALFFPGHGPFFDADSLNGFLVDRREELGR